MNVTLRLMIISTAKSFSWNPFRKRALIAWNILKRNVSAYNIEKKKEKTPFISCSFHSALCKWKVLECRTWGIRFFFAPDGDSGSGNVAAGVARFSNVIFSVPFRVFAWACLTSSTSWKRVFNDGVNSPENASRITIGMATMPSCLVIISLLFFFLLGLFLLLKKFVNLKDFVQKLYRARFYSFWEILRDAGKCAPYLYTVTKRLWTWKKYLASQRMWED